MALIRDASVADGVLWDSDAMPFLLPRVGWHYYQPEYDPFRNICALPDTAAERTLDEIRARYSAQWLVPTYLQERRAVEAWRREEFRAKGRRVLTEHPIHLALEDACVPNYGSASGKNYR